MNRQPVRRSSDGKVRVYGLGWVKPRTAAILAVVTIILLIIFVLYGI
jgi:hypothetical protein